MSRGRSRYTNRAEMPFHRRCPFVEARAIRGLTNSNVAHQTCTLVQSDERPCPTARFRTHRVVHSRARREREFRKQAARTETTHHSVAAAATQHQSHHRRQSNSSTNRHLWPLLSAPTTTASGSSLAPFTPPAHVLSETHPHNCYHSGLGLPPTGRVPQTQLTSDAGHTRSLQRPI